MNRPGVLLDTGPLVALLSKNDAGHARAERLFADCEPPLVLNRDRTTTSKKWRRVSTTRPSTATAAPSGASSARERR